MQIRWSSIPVLLLIIVVWLAACQRDDRTSATPTSPQASQGTFTSPVSSNATTSTNKSPIAPPANTLAEVPFQLEKPIVAGDTKIRGAGPPNIPIAILDITFMGQPVTQGTIDNDGRFEFTVPPLETGHWIGIALGNLDNTGLFITDFQKAGFNGEGATVVPQIGFFYDTFTVVEQ